MPKKFQRTIEDFTCENCGHEVKGNGYTDQCPHCLYSKHVDINPGDRANPCQGLMKPIGIITKGGQPHRIIYACLKCQASHQVKVVEEDNIQEIIRLSKPQI
jgi:hypothetical protein